MTNQNPRKQPLTTLDSTTCLVAKQLNKFKRLRRSALQYLRGTLGLGIALDRDAFTALLKVDEAQHENPPVDSIVLFRLPHKVKPGWYVLSVQPGAHALGSHLSLGQASRAVTLPLIHPETNKRIVRIISSDEIIVSADSPKRHFIDCSLSFVRVTQGFALNRQLQKIANNAQCPAPLFQLRKQTLGELTHAGVKPSGTQASSINDCYNALIERRVRPYPYDSWTQMHTTSHTMFCTDDDKFTPEPVAINQLPLNCPITSLPGNISEPVMLIDPSVMADSAQSLDQSIQWDNHTQQIINRCLHENPDTEVLYFDHDTQDEHGKKLKPVYKPAWNPRLLLSGNYIGAAIVIRPWAYAQAINNIKNHRTDHSHTSLYQWLLALRTLLKNDQVFRIPRVLYTVTVPNDETVPNAHCEATGMLCHPSDLDELTQHLNDNKIGAKARIHNTLPSLDIQFDTLSKPPSVDIIIPTRDRIDLLSQCVEPLIALTEYSNYTITIVDNNSQEAGTESYLKSLVKKHGGLVKVLSWPKEFNYSAINNYAASVSQQDVLVLLNNDTEITHSNWLHELISELEMPNTGCVGAKLLYPSGRIQHAGIMTGERAVAGHAYRFFSEIDTGYLGRLKSPHNVAAVTAACLAIRKKLFDKIGGLDEQHLSVAFNDVDLCLKVRAQGFDVTWTPKVQLNHHESVSRGLDETEAKAKRFAAEIQYMRFHWGDFLDQDCAWHPIFDLQNDHWEIAPWCRVETP